MRALFAAIVLLVSPACGGGSGSPLQTPAFDDLAALRAMQAAQLAELENASFTSLAQIPTQGTANFDGVVEASIDLETNAPSNFVGRLTVQIDFARSDQIASGEVRDVFETSGERLSGNLLIVSSTLSRTIDPNVDRTLSLGLTGDLIDTSGVATSYRIRLEGDFYGQKPDHIGGIVLGRSENPNGIGQVSGRFTAASSSLH